MHKCMRCGKIVSGIEQIEKGCDCGSKVFVFIRGTGKQAEVDTRWMESEMEARRAELPGPEPGAKPAGISIDSKPIVLEVENIKMLEKGVFEIDLGSLMKNPLVLKDANGVYYVKLPISNAPQFIFG